MAVSMKLTTGPLWAGTNQIVSSYSHSWHIRPDRSFAVYSTHFLDSAICVDAAVPHNFLESIGDAGCLCEHELLITVLGKPFQLELSSSPQQCTAVWATGDPAVKSPTVTNGPQVSLPFGSSGRKPKAPACGMRSERRAAPATTYSWQAARSNCAGESINDSIDSLFDSYIKKSIASPLFSDGTVGTDYGQVNIPSRSVVKCCGCLQTFTSAM